MRALRRISTCAALVAVLCAGAVLPSEAQIPPGLKPFRGAYLTFPGKAFPLTHTGPAFPRISCAPGTFGFCTGTVELRTVGGRMLGAAPIAISSNDNPSVRVPLSRRVRRLVVRSRRLRVRVTIRVHDTRGVWRTSRGNIYLTPPR
jgi:hypothetical protein